MISVSASTSKAVDGGATLNLVADFSRYDTDDIYIHDRLRAWAAVRNDLSANGRGFIYATEDGGDNWTLQWSSPWIIMPIMKLEPSPDRRWLWAVGENSTILK